MVCLGALVLTLKLSRGEDVVGHSSKMRSWIIQVGSMESQGSL